MKNGDGVSGTIEPPPVGCEEYIQSRKSAIMTTISWIAFLSFFLGACCCGSFWFCCWFVSSDASCPPKWYRKFREGREVLLRRILGNFKKMREQKGADRGEEVKEPYFWSRTDAVRYSSLPNETVDDDEPLDIRDI